MKKIVSYAKNHMGGLVFALAIIFSVAVIIYCATSFATNNTKFNPAHSSDYTSGWSVVKSGKYTLLDSVSREKTGTEKTTLSIFNTLPGLMPNDGVLCIQTKNESVSVYLNNELIYEYGENNRLNSLTGVGTVWNMVQLPKNAAGKIIQINLTPLGENVGKAPYPIMLGCRNTLIFDIFLLKLPIICICIIMLTISIIYMIYALKRLFGRQKEALGMLYFGAFAFIATIWTAADALILQFVFSSKAISYILFNSMYLLMPIPFALFIRENFNIFRKTLTCIAIVMSFYFVLRIILFFANVVVFENALYIIHIMMAVEILIALYGCTHCSHEQKKLLIVAMYVMSAMYLTSFLIFYLSCSMEYKRAGYSAFFYIGTIFYIIVVEIDRIDRRNFLYKQGLRAEFYEQCAFTDMFTGLENRAAFEKKIDEIQDSISNFFSVCVIVADLNNLKYTNDTFGHSVGDMLIKDTFSYLKKCFGIIGSVYRIGGDETAVIITNNSEESISDTILRFKDEIEEYNSCHDIKIDIAMGCKYESKPEENIVREIFREADMLMYENKLQIKKNS